MERKGRVGGKDNATRGDDRNDATAHSGMIIKAILRPMMRERRADPIRTEVFVVKYLVAFAPNRNRAWRENESLFVYTFNTRR